MKTVLITGASRGIGRALAQDFLDKGYTVIGTSTIGSLDITHERLHSFALDLSHSESIASCAQEIAALGKPIDILINNAGINVEEESEHTELVIEYLRKTLEINLIGTIDFTERIIPLIPQGGQIIDMSSRAGSLAFTGYTLNYPSYRISKTALNMYTRALALRLEGKIVVSSVHPGWVRTDMGGEEGELSPEEAAENIVAFVESPKETGQFWYKQDKFPW